LDTRCESPGISRIQHPQQQGAPETKGSQKAYLVTLAWYKAINDPFAGSHDVGSSAGGRGDLCDGSMKRARVPKPVISR